MKLQKVIISILLCSMLLASCASNKSTTTTKNNANTKKGALIGAGAGAALGAGIGALIGKGKGAAIGAAIGVGVGAGTGALIGKKMDKQKAELAKIANAKVETVTDVNGVPALKVTFASGILFSTGKANLSDASKKSLTEFATSLKNNPDTDVTIYGHTDNVGPYDANLTVSQNRADAVSTYLKKSGITSSRIITCKGLSYDQPTGDNSTEAGRAQNRRVEIYISANENMINKANNGSL